MFRFLTLPTPQRLRERQLRHAELSRLQHAEAAEYHAAMERMLICRIRRLREEARVDEGVASV